MRQDLIVQQQVKSVWQHMVGVICLNLTTGKQVKKVLPKLFKRYPNATSFLRGRESTQRRMLKDLGMSTTSTVIYPSVSCSAYTSFDKSLPPILPVGPNPFNTYSIQRFISEVVPLLRFPSDGNHEIQVTGRFWADQPPFFPVPLKYYGVIDDYQYRLCHSCFMIAPTSVGTGQQVKIFEALACGTPVVTYRCSVPNDILSLNPSIVAVDTPSEFANAINRLLTDRSFLEQLWIFASQAADRQVQLQSQLPYCMSLEKSLAAVSASLTI